MSPECETTVEVDTTEADEALAQLEVHANMTADQVLRQTRKAYTTLTLLAGVFGQIIPAWFNLMISAVFSIAQTFVAIGQAETLSGIFLFKATLSFAAGALLFAQAINLEMTKQQFGMEMNNTIALLNMYGGI